MESNPKTPGRRVHVNWRGIAIVLGIIAVFVVIANWPAIVVALGTATVASVGALFSTLSAFVAAHPFACAALYIGIRGLMLLEQAVADLRSVRWLLVHKVRESGPEFD
jgi:hypothetical protein